MAPRLAVAVAVAAGMAAVAGAVVAGCTAYVRRAAAGWIFAEQDVPAAPVGLVLGAQVYPNGQPSRFLVGRLELARRLFEAGTIDTILVSGDSLAPEWDEPAAMRRHLVAAGVPDQVIVSDPGGFDTYDSCVRARDAYGVTRLIVITQSYHLPRAVGTARLIGLDAVGVGDRTVEWVDNLAPGDRPRRSEPWRRGAVRDIVACVKTVLDVATSRQPVLSPAAGSAPRPGGPSAVPQGPPPGPTGRTIGAPRRPPC